MIKIIESNKEVTILARDVATYQLDMCLWNMYTPGNNKVKIWNL